jgi:hypothetical protein
VNYHNPHRVGAQIKIAKLILQESGTYNPMFSRPYQTHIDDGVMRSIVRRVEEKANQPITGNTLAGAASGMIQPSATPGAEIPIPMSWAERRIRFIMEVHVMLATGSTMIYYFQGYTSHLGVSHGGHVDPNMDFILNSYIRVTRTQSQGPYGMVVNDVVTESAHIVNGAIVNQIHGDVYSMRPQDIFSGIQAAYTANAYSALTGNNQLNDYRSKLSGESVMSKRSNNVSGQYLAKVVDTYRTGQQLLEFGQGEGDVTGRCYDLSQEPTAFENIFIRQISNIRGTHTSTVFNMSNLIAIDPNVESVTDYITLGNTQSMELHSVGQTSFWNGSDRETLAATILSNAIPALMMDLFITKIYFRTTNHTYGGVPNTVLIDAKSLSTADMTMNYEMFKRRLEQEILFDVSGAGQTTYTLDMYVDLFGETRITISLDGGPAIPYTTPSFCDSLLSPVLALNKDSYFNVVHDMETLFNALPGGRSHGVNTMI